MNIEIILLLQQSGTVPLPLVRAYHGTDAITYTAIVRYFEVRGVWECHEANFETGDGYRVGLVAKDLYQWTCEPLLILLLHCTSKDEAPNSSPLHTE